MVDFKAKKGGKLKEIILEILSNNIAKYGINNSKIGNVLSNIFRHKLNECEWLLKNGLGNSVQERLFNLYNDNREIPKCKICKIHKVRFINFSIGYADCCTTVCTNILKYGVSNPAKNKVIKDKIRSTMVNRYNGIGTGSDIIRQKRNDTIKKRYNKNYQQTETFKNKIKNTSLAKYRCRSFYEK